MTEAGVSVLGPGQHLTAKLDEVDTAGASGVVWGVASPQLNANLVKLTPAADLASHTNNEVDVLLVARTGTGVVTIDGMDHPIAAGAAVLIPAGAERSVQANTELTYLSIHTRRSGPTIASARASGQAKSG